MSNITFNPKFVDSDPVTVINILNDNGAVDHEDLDIARITFDNHGNPKYEVLEYNEEFVKSIISQLSDYIKQLPGKFIIVINNNDVIEDLTDGHFHRAIENLMEILWPLYMTYKCDTLIDQYILDGIYICILCIIRATIPDNSKYYKQLVNSIRIHIDHNYNSQDSSTGGIDKSKKLTNKRTPNHKCDNKKDSSESGVIYKGKWYKSLRSLCKEKGLNYRTIYSRIRRGKTIEEAIDIDLYGKVIYDGKPYKSIRSLCIEEGLKYSTINSRIKRAKTIEEAISIDNNRCKEVVYKGKKYRSLKSFCEEKGLNYNTIYVRIKRYDRTIEEAINFDDHRKASRKDRK